MSDRLFGDRHGPTPNEMRRALDVRASIPPRTEPSRYDQLGPLARALVDDYDALDLAEMLVKAQDELAALRPVARGYCPHCGRGDAAPSVADWEQQRQRADEAEGRLAHLQASSEAAGRYLTRTADERDQLRAAVARVRALADECEESGHSSGHPLTTTHIRDALDPAAGPTATQATDTQKNAVPAITTGLVVQPYRNDRGNTAWVFRCWGTDTCDGWLSLDHGSEQSARRARDRHVAEEHAAPSWTEAAHDRPCTATIEGRATPGGRQVQCTREAGHPENHVGPKQGGNGRVLWTDRNTGAVPHRRADGQRPA